MSLSLVDRLRLQALIFVRTARCIADRNRMIREDARECNTIGRVTAVQGAAMAGEGTFSVLTIAAASGTEPAGFIFHRHYHSQGGPMGRLISSRGAADEIFDDTKTSHTKGSTKPGKFGTITSEILAPVVLLIDTIDTDLVEAKKVADPLLAVLEAANEEVDDLVQRVYDEVWNDVGRPAYDRALTLIFPGGASYYTEGSVDSQPGRMELLAELLERGIHPKLGKAQAQAAADKIRAGATRLQAAVDAARKPANRCSLFERIRTATARVVQFELANYKRALISAGYSETEIHEVIPDRTPKKKAEPKTE